MQLENYTNRYIFKRAFEQSEVTNQNQMIVHPHDQVYLDKQQAPNQQHQFNPYQNNEGTVIGKSTMQLLI